MVSIAVFTIDMLPIIRFIERQQIMSGIKKISDLRMIGNSLAIIILLILIPAQFLISPVNADSTLMLDSQVGDSKVSMYYTNGTTNGNNVPNAPVYIEGYVTESINVRDRPGVLIPIPGALLYFVRDNVVVAQAVSNPVGYYSVLLPAGKYTVVTVARAFQTLITEEELASTKTLNRGLVPIPFNGFVPYIRYPVIEVSPGGEAICIIQVENFQIIDQTVTFTVVTPGDDWQAWFPVGEAMLIRSGDFDDIFFKLKFTGKQEGIYIIKVVANGGSYFAELPVIVIVKTLPYEEINIFSNSPERIIRPGDVTYFTIGVENKYESDKEMDFKIEAPQNWSVSTLNGTAFYVRDKNTAYTNLYAYVPFDTAPGVYNINLSLTNDCLKQDSLSLKVTVMDSSFYDATIKGIERNSFGCPVMNLTEGDPFDIPVRVYNKHNFPIVLYIYADIGDNWDFYIKDIPKDHLRIEPGKPYDFTVRSKVPNGTKGNYTATIYLEYEDEVTTLFTMLNCSLAPLPKKEEKWQGMALTAATAGTILLSLAATMRRKGV